MSEEEQPGGSYFALGAVVGAALGVAMALLFAPQPGEQTRAVLKNRGIELQQRARKTRPDTPAPGVEAGVQTTGAAGDAGEGTGQR